MLQDLPQRIPRSHSLLFSAVWWALGCGTVTYREPLTRLARRLLSTCRYTHRHTNTTHTYTHHTIHMHTCKHTQSTYTHTNTYIHTIHTPHPQFTFTHTNTHMHTTYTNTPHTHTHTLCTKQYSKAPKRSGKMVWPQQSRG